MNKPPAFAISGSQYSHTYGMTLRDYFAARAMQELMGTADIDDCCETAYKWADAMLKAREA
jgi:hypothetical protein